MTRAHIKISSREELPKGTGCNADRQFVVDIKESGDVARAADESHRLRSLTSGDEIARLEGFYWSLSIRCVN
jgi:hypothetical protein